MRLEAFVQLIASEGGTLDTKGLDFGCMLELHPGCRGLAGLVALFWLWRAEMYRASL